jgi:tight adherence protein C
MPGEFVVLSTGCALIGAMLGLVYASSGQHSHVYVLVFGGLFGVVPFVRVSSTAVARLEQIKRSLPTMVDLVCLGLSAGLDFPAAIKQLVDKSRNKRDALREELCVMLHELQLGKTRREVLELFAARAPVAPVREFAAAVIQAEEEGTPLAKVLAIQATVSRQHRSVRAEELASRTGLQLIIPMGLAFLTILILIAGPLALVVMEEFSRG